MTHIFRPLPSEPIDVLEILGCGRVAIRPARPGDEDLHRAFVRALSPQSRHSRFMSGIRDLSEQMARDFCRIDDESRFALIACVAQGGRETMIGEARYVVDDPAAGVCEFALSVADEWQGNGLGRDLLGRIVRRASASGLSIMHGFALAQNESMIWLAMQLGFATEPDFAAGDIVRMEIALGDLSATGRAAAPFHAFAA